MSYFNDNDFSEWRMNNAATSLMDKLSKKISSDNSQSMASEEKIREQKEQILVAVRTIEEQSKLLGKYEGHPECDLYASEASDLIKTCYKKLDIILM